MPVIAAGQERAVLALIQPWALGQEVVPGWFLESIKLDVTKIRFVFKASQGAQRALVLEFPGRVPQAKETTKSFAVIREAPSGDPPPVPDPLDVLAAAIKKNDVETFWSTEVPNDPIVGPGGQASAPPSRRDWQETWRALPNDGIALFLGALIFVLTHLRRQLRQDPPWVAPALLAVVVVGAVLRVLLPHENLMEAWAYERLAPLAGRIYDGPILQWFNAIAGGHLFLTDVLFKSNYVLAVVMPLVMYAHARYVLHDHRSAIAAAALLAVLPEHLRFSRSDVYMIQSLATSSLTFVVLYTALTDRSRAWRVASLLILPLLCTATYFVRPENIVFVVLDLGAIYICARAAGGLSLRSFVAASIVLATALVAFVVNLLTNYSGSLEHGLSLQTLSNALHILFNGRLNTLVNPWITPPPVTILAVLGAVGLWRRDDRRRAIFLITWLGGFFLVHSFVLPDQAAMQARYHMNLITPLVLLAAAATPAVLTWRPLARYLLVAYLAAAPLMHRHFIGDTEYNEMREFTFLTALRDRIPPDCTVIEYSGLPGEGMQTRQFAPRVGRVSSLLAGGRASQYWKVVAAAAVDAGGPATQQSERLSTATKDLLDAPPSCLVFYEGLTCASLRRPGQEQAPICQTIRDRLDLVPIATARFASRIYDPVMAGYLGVDDTGRSYSNTTLPEGAPVTLTAFRLRDPSGRD